jgi:hypothetical protein
VLAQVLGALEPTGLFDFRGEVMSRELVGLVEDREVPPGVAELLLELLVGPNPTLVPRRAN